MPRKWWSKRVIRKNKDKSSAYYKRHNSRSYQPILEFLEKRDTPSTFDVTNTNDTGAGSLRQAITDANNHPGSDLIDFIIGKTVETISIGANLPTITDPVTIDGTPQSAANNGQIIQVSGPGAGAGVIGFRVGTGGSGTIIRGLVINSFGGNAIEFDVGGNTVEGSFIGTDTAGANAANGNGNGIFINNSANNTIGGTSTPGFAAGAGNLISGNGSAANGDGILIQGANATGNVIKGNFIGTVLAGTSALGNQQQGIEIVTGSGNTVGGTTASARNIISGNSGNGIWLNGPSNLVQGNYIGTNSSGTSAVGNASNGIQINTASNIIGGTVSGAGNVISGNLDDGLNITTTNATGNVIQGNFIGTDKTGSVAVPNSNNPANLQGGAGIQLNNASGNLIGGTISAARNVISGNTSPHTARGVWIDNGAAGNVIEGNYIGLNAAGTAALANDIGVLIEVGAGAVQGSHDNTVGGSTAAAGNVISGNTGSGIEITDMGTTGNLVENNSIGTDKAGTGKVANAVGITIQAGASGNSVGGSAAGTGNLISGNTGDGVVITDAGTSNNVIQSNAIGTNTTVTGALANQDGVHIQSGAKNNTIGGTTSVTGNIISGNKAAGVLVSDSGTSGNAIEGNFIGLESSGTTALANVDGVMIQLAASNNTIGGNVAGSGNLISGNSNSGLTIDGTGTTGNKVLNNVIGLDVTGSASLANQKGVIIQGGATGNTIGTTLAGFGNVISGNSADGVQVTGSGTSNNQVEGNFIGTDSAGAVALANSVGVSVQAGASKNTIGGTASGAANLISGNSTQGVLITGASSNLVQGNFIGSDTGGTLALPNMSGGVAIQGAATGNIIGGTTVGVTNVISGNQGDGVAISGSGSNGNFVQGNFIGTQNDGTTPLANTGNGVSLGAGVANNTIGGSILTGGGNIIGSNGLAGILVDSVGTTNFSGANLNTNSTNINSGTLKLTASNAIPATSAVIVNQNGTLDLNNNSDTVASLADGAGGGGNVVLGSRTLGVGNDTNSTFSGVISGVNGALQAGTFVKNGSGTLILKGNNTYLGTVVSAGTLLIDGMHSGTSPTDSVGAGTTLGGTGTAGFTTVNGTVSPGNNAIGTLTVQGALFKSGSSAAFELKNASTYDQLAGNSAINLGNNVAMLNITLVSGFASNVNDVFSIVSDPAGVSGTFGGVNGTVMALPDGATFSVSGTIFLINYLPTLVKLTHVAASTTTSLITGVSPSTVGFQVTFTATVSVVSPGTGTPTGSVTFMDGTTTLGMQNLSNGQASFSTSSLAIGEHMITAVYAGTPSFGGSTSNTVTQDVISGQADHFVVSAPSTTKAGAPFSFTVTAKDSFGNTSTTFTDTVNVTTSDPIGNIQTTPYTFTTGPGGDNGVHVFTVTLKSAGLQSVTVTDTISAGISATANVQVVATFGKDIVGRVSSTGQWFVGLSNGSSGFTNSLFATWNPAVHWTDVRTGDFDGDGRTDIAGRDPSTGFWYVGLSTGTSFNTTAWTNWSTSVTWVDIRVGDFNGDGKMDIAGRNLQTGDWWVAQSNGSSFTNKLWDTWSPLVTWVDVQVGDFNGDGKADLVGRVLSAGTWWTGLSSGSNFTTTMWTAWSTAVTWVDVQVGDFSGDGKSDITGRALQNGQWWTAISNGTTAFNTNLWATWNPGVTWADVRVGDFNGDGKADIVGRWQQAGLWFVGLSNGSVFTTTQWASWNPSATWVDVQVGDFNADGKTDIAGRWLQAGQWFVGISNGSSVFTTSPWTMWNPNVTWVDVHAGNFG
jgi:hypothetical protein